MARLATQNVYACYPWFTPTTSKVEMWTHGKLAARLGKSSSGIFWLGTLDLTTEPNGPLLIATYAYDVPPGGTPLHALASRQIIIVTGSSVPPVNPSPIGAQGMTLKWSDEFNSLSATPCKPGTGTWPNCSLPTASDGFTWYENKPSFDDLGDAAFERTDSPYNPYFTA